MRPTSFWRHCHVLMSSCSANHVAFSSLTGPCAISRQVCAVTGDYELSGVGPEQMNMHGARERRPAPSGRQGLGTRKDVSTGQLPDGPKERWNRI
jgi:hypothetical protein